MGFTTNITLIEDGQDVDAAVTNVPLVQLQNNDNWLMNLITALQGEGGPGSAALFFQSVVLDSGVLLGQPVYFDSGSSTFKQALDDGTSKRNVVGLCYAITGSNVGTLLVGGWAPLDMTNAIGSADAPGRYFLSTEDPGEVTTAIGGVQVCTIDASGNVFFSPRVQDTSNYIIEIAPATTVDFAVTLFSLQNTTGGIQGFGTLLNTGSNPIQVTETVIDYVGPTTYAMVTAIAPGGYRLLNPNQPFGTAYPPYSAYAVSVQSLTPTDESTYEGNFLANRF